MADLSLSRSQLLLLAGTANQPLAEEMAEHLGQPLCAVTIRPLRRRGNFRQIDDNVRGRMCSSSSPPTAGGEPPGAVVPDRRRAPGERGADHGGAAVLRLRAPGSQGQPRVAISAKSCEPDHGAGADRVLGMDFHSHQLQGSSTFRWTICTRHRYREPLPAEAAVRSGGRGADVGSAKMARGFAKRLTRRSRSSTSGARRPTWPRW